MVLFRRFLPAALLLAAASTSAVAADASPGRELVAEFGCAACHVVPGIRGAEGLVGPPLTGIGRRVYIAGILPNTHDNMVRWLLDPPAVNPRTAMPNVGLSAQQASDVAAWLATLK